MLRLPEQLTSFEVHHGVGPDVHEIVVEVPGGPSVPAWLVRLSAGAGAEGGAAGGAEGGNAGVLWLHWLGELRPDRPRPSVRGDRDSTPARAHAAAVAAVLAVLRRDHRVDRDRLATIGHDYSAMARALCAPPAAATTRPRDVATVVVPVPQIGWGGWFATSWLELTEPEADVCARHRGRHQLGRSTRVA